MKIDKKIYITLVIIGLLFFIYLLRQELSPYKEEALLAKSPFSELKILNQNVEINPNNRFYKNDIDCSKLEPNTQILSYELTPSKEEYKVTTFIQVFSGNHLLKDNYQDITHIKTNIVIQDPEQLYEQIYIIESTCQQGDNQWKNK